MKLNLKRPLAFFDLEATGINVGSDRIVEIAILKAMPNGTEEILTKRINPQMPIPLVTSLIHGIYDEDIKDAQTFNQAAKEIADFIGNADLAGYNSNKFDIPMLLEEFLRAGIDFDMSDRKFVDVQNIFHQMEQRTLKAAYQFYCKKDKRSDFKYNKIINKHNSSTVLKILNTCLSVVPMLLQLSPNCNFALLSSRSVDFSSSKRLTEGLPQNQRFRIYSRFIQERIGNITFTHFAYEKISSYLLINNNEKDIYAKETRVKEIFERTYKIIPDIGH